MAGTYTDEASRYTLEGLPTGDYNVRSMPSEKEQDYVDRWYSTTGGVIHDKDAEPVSVTAPMIHPASNLPWYLLAASPDIYAADGQTPSAGLYVYVVNRLEHG